MVKKIPLDFRNLASEPLSVDPSGSANPANKLSSIESAGNFKSTVENGKHSVPHVVATVAPYGDVSPTNKLDILCEAVKTHEEKNMTISKEKENRPDKKQMPKVKIEHLYQVEVKPTINTTPLISRTAESIPLAGYDSENLSPLKNSMHECIISPPSSCINSFQQWRGSYNMCSPIIRNASPFPHHPPMHYLSPPSVVHSHATYPTPHFSDHTFCPGFTPMRANSTPPIDTIIRRPDFANSNPGTFPHDRACCQNIEEISTPVHKKTTQAKKKISRKASHDKLAGVRMCQSPGCKKCAQGSTKFCIAHGGGRRCTVPGCLKGARDKKFCSAHGGGKRCSTEGCTKAAVGGSKLCTAHGGGRRCATEGCEKSAQSSTRYCVRHGGGRQCSVEGCTKVSRGKTMFCASHGGGKRCTWEGCTKSAVAKGIFCKRHSACSVPPTSTFSISPSPYHNIKCPT